MPSGQPDFWTATIPGMPAIGAGQVAWFQSDTAVVGAEGSRDLINYVVPDNMELHVCSGVVSCGLPRLQRYDLRQTPAATWISPTGHSDPEDKWSYEEYAYDGDTSTPASQYIPADSWGSFLELILNAVTCDKLRSLAYFRDISINLIDLDVYYEANWHHVYQGAFADREWVEKDIPEGEKLVSKARVRFYNDLNIALHCILYELQLDTSGATPQEGIYFDTHAIIPYLPEAPYLVPAGATFAVRMYNDDDAAQNMSVSLAGFLQQKV